MDPARHPPPPSGPAARSARRGAVLALEGVAAVARHLAESAMVRGDWNGAADYEERALAAEHKAALLRDADLP